MVMYPSTNYNNYAILNHGIIRSSTEGYYVLKTNSFDDINFPKSYSKYVGILSHIDASKSCLTTTSTPTTVTLTNTLGASIGSFSATVVTSFL